MKHSIRGFSMIEVMIAVLVVSFGVLGIAGALFTATRSATSNYVRQQAVQDAYDILDRMRANRTVAAQAGGSYTATATKPSSTAPSTNCTTSTCSGAQMAAYDVWQWQTQLMQNLPNGLGSVTIAAGSNSSYTVTVQVQWSDQAGNTAFTPSGTPSTTPQTYTVVSAL